MLPCDMNLQNTAKAKDVRYLARFQGSHTIVSEDREGQCQVCLIYPGDQVTAMTHITGLCPRDYHPSLNAPAVQADEYDPYEPLGVHHIPRPNNPRLPHGLNNSDQEMPIPISLPEDDSTQTEQFLTSMGKMDEIEQVVPEGPFLNINEQNLSKSTPIESAKGLNDDFNN